MRERKKKKRNLTCLISHRVFLLDQIIKEQLLTVQTLSSDDRWRNTKNTWPRVFVIRRRYARFTSWAATMMEQRLLHKQRAKSPGWSTRAVNSCRSRRSRRNHTVPADLDADSSNNFTLRRHARWRDLSDRLSTRLHLATRDVPLLSFIIGRFVQFPSFVAI